MTVFVILFVVAAIVLIRSTVVLKPDERAVVYRLGRPVTVIGPGLAVITPFVDRLTRVSMSEQELQLPEVKLSTRDQLSSTVSARVRYRILDPLRSLTEVQDLRTALEGVVTSTLRAIAGEVDYDHLISSSADVADATISRADEVVEKWGAKILSVEIERQRF